MGGGVICVKMGGGCHLCEGGWRGGHPDQLTKQCIGRRQKGATFGSALLCQKDEDSTLWKNCTISISSSPFVQRPGPPED